MGRRPLGKRALTPAQKQRRYRVRKKKAEAATLHMTRIERLSADARAVAAKATAELTTGRLFPVICADPPWHFETYSEKGMSRHAARHYPTMSTEAICAIVPPAASDCGLYLWVPPSMTEAGMRVVAAWDFVKVSSLLAQAGPGSRLLRDRGSDRGTVGVPPWTLRGAPAGHADAADDFASATRAQREAGVFYDHIMRLHPGCDLLEMFVRPPLRPGWWSWGDEVPGKLAPPP